MGSSEVNEHTSNKSSGWNDIYNAPVKPGFPTVLMRLVTEDVIPNVRWHPSGEAIVLDKAGFDKAIGSVFPELFGDNKLVNFVRQLKVYGFKERSLFALNWRDYRDEFEVTPGLCAYEHPFFKRDFPEDFEKVVKVKDVRKNSSKVTRPRLAMPAYWSFPKYAGIRSEQQQESPDTSNDSTLNSQALTLDSPLDLTPSKSIGHIEVAPVEDIENKPDLRNILAVLGLQSNNGNGELVDSQAAEEGGDVDKYSEWCIGASDMKIKTEPQDEGYVPDNQQLDLADQTCTCYSNDQTDVNDTKPEINHREKLQDSDVALSVKKNEAAPQGKKVLSAAEVRSEAQKLAEKNLKNSKILRVDLKSFRRKYERKLSDQLITPQNLCSSKGSRDLSPSVLNPKSLHNLASTAGQYVLQSDSETSEYDSDSSLDPKMADALLNLSTGGSRSKHNSKHKKRNKLSDEILDLSLSGKKHDQLKMRHFPASQFAIKLKDVTKHQRDSFEVSSTPKSAKGPMKGITDSTSCPSSPLSHNAQRQKQDIYSSSTPTRQKHDHFSPSNLPTGDLSMYPVVYVPYLQTPNGLIPLPTSLPASILSNINVS